MPASTAASRPSIRNAATPRTDRSPRRGTSTRCRSAGWPYRSPGLWMGLVAVTPAATAWPHASAAVASQTGAGAPFSSAG